MKAGDLLRDFRRPSRADDGVKQSQFATDPDVLGWMAEAEREACIRSRLLYDETTPEICRVRIAPSRIRYNLDHRIREIVDIWVDRPPSGQPTSSTRMHLVDQSNAQRRPFPFLFGSNYNFDSIRAAPGTDYGNSACGWNEALQTGNHLRQASIDGYALSLYTIPDQSFASGQAPAVLRLCTYRLPLKSIKNVDDCFEIPEIHQDGLIYWLLYRFFGGADVDTEDPMRRDRALKDFTDRFGERPSADVMRQQQDNRSGRMAYAGY